MLARSMAAVHFKPSANPPTRKLGSKPISTKGSGTPSPAKSKLSRNGASSWQSIMRKLYERRWELPGRLAPFYDFPQEVHEVASSLFWYCAYCGIRYAEMRAWCNEVPAKWAAVSGCCPNCPGNRFGIPGSIESVYLMRLQQPHLILEYQLSCEIAFLNSKDHPHNDNS